MEAAFLDPRPVLLVPLAPPPLPPRKVAEILPALLAAQLPFPQTDCVYAFTPQANGSVLAHAVRKTDLEKELAAAKARGSDPDRLLPPGPVAWAHAVPLLAAGSDGPVAVVIAADGGYTLATGHGPTLETVSNLPADSARLTSALRLAFAGIPRTLKLLAVGACARDLAGKLDAALSVKVPDDPVAFLDEAAQSDAAEAYNLRIGAFEKPGHNPVPRRLLAASVLFCLAAAAFCWTSFDDFSMRNAKLRNGRVQLRHALEEIAGHPVSTRGQAAVDEARADGVEIRESRILAPSAESLAFPIVDAARTARIRISHLTIEEGRPSVSGVAANAESIDRFLEALGANGVPMVRGEAPKPSETGLSFFLLPGGVSR